MKKIISLTSAIFCVKLGLACGGGWFPNEEYYYLFNQELISDTAMFPLLYDMENPYYDEGFYFEDPQFVDFPKQDPNLLAWQSYLGGQISLQDIALLLYQVSETDLRLLYQQIELGLLGNQKDIYQKNEIVQAWAKERYLPFYHYLIYAKQCARQASHSDNHWQTPQRNEMLMIALLNSGLGNHSNEKVQFLKDRYAFQVVRMAHYLGMNEPAVHYFDSLFNGQPESYIYFRAMEQAGGALRAMGEPKAAYYFSRVFDALPDRNEVALSSFRVTDNGEWERALSYCKTTEQEVVFNVMRAFQQGGLDIEEMEKVYAKLPSSPYLDVLLMRQINQYERHFRSLPGGFEHAFYNEAEQQQFFSYLQRLQDLLHRAVQEEKVINLPLFKLGLSQVLAWNEDKAKALAYLQKQKFVGKYKKQAEVLSFDLRLQLLAQLSPVAADKFEEEYFQSDHLSKVADLRPRMINLYGQHFLKQKDTARAFLCYNRLSNLEDHLHLGTLQDLQLYFASENESALDEYLKSPGHRENSKKYLNFLRGKYYFLRNDLALAEEWWAKNGEDYFSMSNADDGRYERYDAVFGRSVYNTNPGYSVKHQSFLPQTDSLHEEFIWLNKSNSFLSFVRELQTIEERALQENDQSARLYLMLANAWINMSPEGWYRMILSEQGSYYGGTKYIPQPENFTHYGSPSYYYYDPDIALQYAQRGLDAAKDENLKAKLTYVSAQAEMQAYLIEEVYKTNRYNLDFRYQDFLSKSDYFGEMIDKYQQTAFYQQAIKECGFFAQRVKLEGQ